MLTEIYIEAILVNEELAEQVWEAWVKGEIDDSLAVWCWSSIVICICRRRRVMATWNEEFARLSEIEGNAVDEWKANPHAANAVINAKEATNALLIRYQQAGCPPHDTEIP